MKLRNLVLAACLATLALVSFALAHVHGAMHTPRNRWIERQRWFTSRAEEGPVARGAEAARQRDGPQELRV